MIYRNNTRRFLVLALMLALVLFGNLPFNSGISAPAAAAPPPSAVAGSPVTDQQTRARAAESFGKLPLYFVENRGQLDKRVNYYVQGSDKTIYFTNQGLTFLLSSKPESTRWSVKLDFVGARHGVRPEGREQTGATFSYFKGPRSQWQAGLKSYSEIVYRELWPGIDLVYAGTVNRMKYTFVVKPGADPNRIKLAWRGASGVKLNAAGELEVTTPAGGFTDERPVSWQETNGQQVDVATKYRIEPKREQPSNAAVAYGFELGEYDRSRELVIDPAVLVYCGYIGGASSAIGSAIAVDSAGNAYIFGSTNSTEASFPVTAGPDLTFNGGAADTYVAKVNASGTALVYSGYIGGSGIDQALGIAVDSGGNAYVSGSTNSTEASFPVTVGPDLTFNGGGNDAFVAKVNASGTALDYCGYIGGSGIDGGLGIAVDNAGNAYVTGETNSTDATFPVTAGPDLTFNGSRDAYVAKVNASGTALVYCGYIGGSGFDQGFGVAVDSGGNAYITGNTSSTEATFPVAVGPDLTHNGFQDAFVAKVNASGMALVYCGYIGGKFTDSGTDIAVDSAGNAYVSGSTVSTEAENFPVTVGPDLTFNGAQDAFVAKISIRCDNCAYVANSNDFTVSVIDPATNTVVASVPVGLGAIAVAVTPNGAFAYVTGANAVSVINTATNTVIATVPIGAGSTSLAITPNGAFVYVVNDFSDTVSVIATANNAVIATVPVGSNPRGVAITPDGAFAYVTNLESLSVSVINTTNNAVVTTIPLGKKPFHVAITPNGAFAYVTTPQDLTSATNSVTVINTATNAVTATIPVGNSPFGVAITPNGAFAYVTNFLSNDVSVINTASNAVIATVPVGSNPIGVAVRPDGAVVYVTNFLSKNVSVISTATNAVVATIPVGDRPFSVAFSPDPISAIIGELQALIDAGTLTQDQGNGLLDKLNEVIAKLGAGQTGAACNQLNSFISQVNAFINNGSLTTTQGQALIDGANAIKADIGCP